MKLLQTFFRLLAFSLLLANTGAWAQLAGTVTDRTTGKPAAGDAVALVDTQAGMSEVARTVTDARGHYLLAKSGSGSYQVRVTHQGLSYLIAAPDGSAPGDLAVYDVAARVPGIYIETAALRVEVTGGRLQVTERYLLRNPGSPPVTQWGARSLLVFLPPGAVAGSASAQRAGGPSVALHLVPDSSQGCYAVNLPIQPDSGSRGTRLQIEYKVPFGNGSFTFHPQFSLPAQSVSVLVPRSLAFTAGADFHPGSEVAGARNFVARNVTPGKALEFTVSPAEAAQSGDRSAPADAAGARPDKSSGSLFDSSADPLSKFKWWILSGLLLLLAVATLFLMRKPPASPGASAPPPALHADRSANLRKSLREELLSLEKERAAGALTPDEYAEMKAALEAVLRRTLKKDPPPPAPGA